MTISFLEDALIAEKTIRTGTYIKYTPESSPTNNSNMVIDSQCLEHLEVIETANGQREGSLLNFVDHCQTHFGKRQIKRWIMAPLIDVEQISQR